MDKDVRACATCGAEFVTVTGAELCRKCRNKARSKELYNERKSAGLCTQCGAPALDTRITVRGVPSRWRSPVGGFT